MSEHDPLLVTFDQVAATAGVSRSLVHAYLGDRRGLIDAVQVRIVARLDRWVGHGTDRADGPDEHLRAVATGLFAFVGADPGPWGVLVASGGLDHPALHGVRARWARPLVPPGRRSGDTGEPTTGAVAAIAALVDGVGGWVARGVEPDEVIAVLAALLPR